MPDLVETLAAEGGKDLVQALVAGLVHWVGKVPGLWRHAGPEVQERMAGALERTAVELNAAGPDREPATRAAQAVWKTRLEDLLADYPQVRPELENLLGELRRELPTVVGQTQHIVAHQAPAYGVMNGNIINHYHDGGRRLPDPPSYGAEPAESP